MDTDSEAYYSDIEVEERLIKALTQANIARIIKAYNQTGCEARVGTTAEDVLNTVIKKALQLKRKWPRDLPDMAYLIQTGKGVINNEAEKQKQHHLVESVETYLNLPEAERDPVCLEAARSQPGVDITLENDHSDSLLNEWVTKILELFKDDPEASCYLENKLANFVKAQIIKLCGLTDQVYRNIEKRIKYNIRKRFPNGIPWWEISS